MRALLALAAIVLGVASAHAADLDFSRGFRSDYAALGARAQPIVIYDYHPGVIVRAYWRAPWRNRHYYPTTGEKPEIGRDEDLSAPSNVSASPDSFERTWTTCTTCGSERPPQDSPREQSTLPEPRDEPFRQPTPPLK